MDLALIQHSSFDSALAFNTALQKISRNKIKTLQLFDMNIKGRDMNHSKKKMSHTCSCRVRMPNRAGNERCKKISAMLPDTRKKRIGQAKELFRSTPDAGSIAILFELVYNL
jgi:hypothetical protein